MWLNRRVSLTISPSADVAEWLADYGATAEKVLVFPNAIDVEPFAQPWSPKSKADLGLASDSFALCYVGRIAHEKNVALLLDAFARAASRDSRLALVLVGDGPARAECERAARAAGIAERVRFTGMVPYERVPDVLVACDAFATASVSEMYPLVVVEGCAAGLPVIGVRSPGVREIVSAGESGLLTAEEPESSQRAMPESRATICAPLPSAGCARWRATRDRSSTARLIASTSAHRRSRQDQGAKRAPACAEPVIMACLSVPEQALTSSRLPPRPAMAAAACRPWSEFRSPRMVSGSAQRSTPFGALNASP
jgi:hypothetical protein